MVRQFTGEVDDIVDSIEEYLESRADEPPSVIGEFSFVADVVDDKESRNSESSDDWQVASSAQRFVELLSKSAQSRGNKSAAKFSNKDSDSEEEESEEDKLDKGKFDSKDFDRLFKGIKKPALTVFSGDKDLYQDWKAQFEIIVVRMKVPAKTKMTMLKNSLSGKPLRVVERSGYTSKQYQTALEKLDQKYGGEKRLLQRYLEAILRASPVEETNLKELEIFSDRLTDVVVKLEDSDQHQELAGVSALYIAVQQKLPGSLLSHTKNGCTGSPGRMDYPYFLNGYRSKLFIVWTSKKLRREPRKRQKVMSSQGNTSMRKEQFTTSPENPHPSVLSAMDLTK